MFLLYLRELFIGWCAGFVLLQDALSAIRVSGNLDPPESLLDGLMQSVVCQKVRYIVLFFSLPFGLVDGVHALSYNFKGKLNWFIIWCIFDINWGEPERAPH